MATNAENRALPDYQIDLSDLIQLSLLNQLEEHRSIILCREQLDQATTAIDNDASQQTELGDSSVPPCRKEESSMYSFPAIVDTSIAVALHIPDFQRKSDAERPIKHSLLSILRIDLSELLASPPTYYNLLYERIAIPGEVKACGHFLVSCIDVGQDWNPKQLILELFKHGYGGAELAQDVISEEASLPDTILDVREMRQTSLWESAESEEKRKVDLYPNKPDPKFSLFEPLLVPPGCDLPQSWYKVIFPNMCRSAQEVLSNVTHEFFITVTNNKFRGSMLPQFIKVPAAFQILELSVARVKHSGLGLDVANLVAELLHLGCGSVGPNTFQRFLPHTLSCGGIIDHYRPLQSSVLSRIQGMGSSFPLAPVATQIPLDSPYYSGQMRKQALSSIAQSPMSNFSSWASFMTGSSPASFLSARSTFDSPAYTYSGGFSPAMRIETIREDEPPEPSMPTVVKQLHVDYFKTLHQDNIVQPFDKELNWSGKGQHVTFPINDAIPLTILSHLGSSINATVEKVICRRIALARKTMRCHSRWTVAEALREVYHLQNLRHFHIVQLVGSYLQGRNFSILMYPAANCHLGTFLEDTSDMRPLQANQNGLYIHRVMWLSLTLSCLVSAVAFIHDRTTKHMDIKPQNILIRAIPRESTWRIYLADFGLSRSFVSQGHSQTDGPTSRTPRYCAPEVYGYEKRGRSADMFSLGCVFLEILTVVCGKTLHDFADARRGDGEDESFHANLERISAWVDEHLRAYTRPDLLERVRLMISEQPDKRPLASESQTFFSQLPQYSPFRAQDCCRLSPEPYEAYQGS
ncbi:kinase-like domain-containing protein [Pyrenochaeta sp. MPI-SDFR-AT-0127]|nr:kinase-like domain-containing protein [Pyrenochaeta sp. MPI-SDFR-AT-0127]